MPPDSDNNSLSLFCFGSLTRPPILLEVGLKYEGGQTVDCAKEKKDKITNQMGRTLQVSKQLYSQKLADRAIILLQVG